MRDPKWIAVHRGGMLEPDVHRQLMRWAIDGMIHLHAWNDISISPLHLEVLTQAEYWIQGLVNPGKLIKLSRQVHAEARSIAQPELQWMARAVGHVAAIAHMADHALGVFVYGRKIASVLGMNQQRLIDWQWILLGMHAPSMVTAVEQLLDSKRLSEKCRRRVNIDVARSIRAISVTVKHSAQDVYSLASNTKRLADWAEGINDQVNVCFIPDHAIGLWRHQLQAMNLQKIWYLDHVVSLPNGTVGYNPMRLTNHPEGSEITFYLIPLTGMTNAEMDRDVMQIQHDLHRIERCLPTSNR